MCRERCLLWNEHWQATPRLRRRRVEKSASQHNTLQRHLRIRPTWLISARWVSFLARAELLSADQKLVLQKRPPTYSRAKPSKNVQVCLNCSACGVAILSHLGRFLKWPQLL